MVDGSWPIQTEMGIAVASLRRQPFLLRLACLQEASRRSPAPAGTTACWRRCGPTSDAAARLLGRRHSRPRLRLGRHRTRRWKPTASTPSSRRPTSPARSCTVAEFLAHVRRMVVDFVVGRVLTATGDADLAAVDRPGRHRRPTTCSTATTSVWTTPPSGPASSTPVLRPSDRDLGPLDLLLRTGGSSGRRGGGRRGRGRRSGRRGGPGSGSDSGSSEAQGVDASASGRHGLRRPRRPPGR